MRGSEAVEGARMLNNTRKSDSHMKKAFDHLIPLLEKEPSNERVRIAVIGGLNRCDAGSMEAAEVPTFELDCLADIT